MNQDEFRTRLNQYHFWVSDCVPQGTEPGFQYEDLRNLDLSGLNLRNINFRGANLAGANLSGAYVTDADFEYAILRGANLTGLRPFTALQPSIDLTGAIIEGVPVVPDLERRTLEMIESGEARLAMEEWHIGDVSSIYSGTGRSCGTAHCRAGFAIHLAGHEGYVLERKHGPEKAGAMIYIVSAGYYPSFFTTNEEALEDLRTRVNKRPAGLGL